MSNTPNLTLPRILAGQAQKHVTHNEALRVLDGLVQLSVKDRDLATPPGSPAEGDRYIVAASPTGAWTGWAGSVALFEDGAWLRLIPREGWLAWVADEQIVVSRVGSAWQRAVPRGEEVPFLMPPSGDCVLTTTGAGGAAPGSGAGVADRLEIAPWIARADLTIDAVQVNVSTGVAGAQGKVVCYGSDANGRPDVRLFETAALDFATIGLKTGTIAFTFLRGETYWFGLRHSSTATVTLWPSTGVPDLNGGAPAPGGARKVLRRAITFASAAPTPWVWSSAEMQAGPPAAIWLRRA